jgi:hypothetical protein
MGGSLPAVVTRRRTATALLAGAAAVAAMSTQTATAGAQSAAAERVTDLAVRGLGGERALRDLSSFRLRSTGRTFIFNEGVQPGNSVSPASTFTPTLNYDLRRRGDRLRADYVRNSLGTDRRVSEVVVGRRGFITGVDANNSQPTDKPMLSDRWGAITREQRLLIPQLHVRELLSDPDDAAAFPSRRVNGRLHRVLNVSTDVADVRLYVNATSGRISRLTTTDHNYNRGDVRTVVDYAGWQRAATAGSPSRAR